MQVAPPPDTAIYRNEMLAPNLFNLLHGLNAGLDTFATEGSCYYDCSHMFAV
jgi:hypothetical protein